MGTHVRIKDFKIKKLKSLKNLKNKRKKKKKKKKKMVARNCDRMKAKHRLGSWQTQVSCRGFSCGSMVKESACNAGDLGWIPGSGRPLEKGMATHSSTLA